MRNKSILFIVFLLVSLKGSAQNRQHTVLAGQTIYSIARFYEVSPESLKAANKLSGNQLSVGQVLRIPSTGQVTTATAIPTSKPADSALADVPKFHVVLPKETLFSISKRYNRKPEELRLLNNRPSGALNIGDTLWLSKSGDGVQTGTQNSAGSEIKLGSIETPRFHTVDKGETLYRIANLYGMAVEDLRKLNQLTSNELVIGSQLKIATPQIVPAMNDLGSKSNLQGSFISYEWTAADNLPSILAAHKMDSLEFSHLNPGLQRPVQGDVVVLFSPPNRLYPNPYKSTSTPSSAEERINATLFTDKQVGLPLSSGILYAKEMLVLGHPTFKIGTVVEVEGRNGKRVFAQVLDRTSGPIMISEKLAKIISDGSIEPIAIVIRKRQ